MKTKIFAETRYIFFVNDCFVGEGPCRGAKGIRYFDEISCTEFLKEGNNSIVVKVLHMQENGKFTSVEIEEYDFSFDVEATYNYGLIGGYELKQRPVPPMACLKNTEFKIIKQGKNFIELDAGKYVTAKVGFLLKGKIGDCARIIYSL